MSGTSLDGIDLAFCELQQDKGAWTFDILKAETLPYSASWKSKLESLPQASAEHLAATDTAYGQFLGKIARSFCTKHALLPNFIASHGHTVFHQPPTFTFQLGHGAHLAAISRFPVINDFRSSDLALGGQGAPLVPIGDQLLFSDMDACLNLGGFSNISFKQNDLRIAFDVGPANIVLNELAQAMGQPYDDQGKIARNGKLHQPLLTQLNALEYYQQAAPKSLGREWVEHVFVPVLRQYDLSISDQLHTCTVHMAQQIAHTLQTHSIQRVLITGGGAYNTFFIDSIRGLSNADFVVPDDTLVNFKEALIFAFLGVLRWTGQNNCLASVTGASKDHCSGSIHLP